MDTLGNAFYDIGCAAADQLDAMVANRMVSLRMAYWMFDHCNLFAGSVWGEAG
jgi:hypothetical protein